PAIALLDAWATIGDVLTFYQERIANEGYLRTAIERRSVLELARLIGYSLRPGVAASAYLAYTLDKPIAIPPLIDKPQLAPEPPDPLVTIPAGSRAQSIPGPGELPQSFETSADIVTRFAWNDLQVRLSRPQKIKADTRVIYLKGLQNLKPGDPILIIASPPNLFRIETVTLDAANDRTKVTFRPWLEIELPRARPAALVEAVAAIVKQFGAPERFGVVSTSKSGREVLAQLNRLRKLEAEGTPEELSTALEKEVIPKLNDLHQAAIAGRFTRVEPWVRSIVSELEAALQGRAAGPRLMVESNSGRSKTTADLTSVLSSLAKAPSIPPRSSSDLARTVGLSLGVNTDIAPQVLTSLHPQLKPVLYKAWENVPVTAAPEFEVHSFKVRSSVFGHNAPLEQMRNTAGVITGSKEWDLQVPGPTSTEHFDLVVRQVSEGVFQAEVIIGQFLTGFVDLHGPTTTIDFPTANDKVEVHFSRTSERLTFQFHFSRRPIHVEIAIGLQQQSATSLNRDPLVTIDQQPTGSIRTDDLTVTTKGSVTIAGAATTREEPRVLWLDAPYDQILPGSWVALEKPSSVIDTVTHLPLESTVVVARAADVSERSRAEYGISLKSTRLRLDSDWIDPTRGGDTFATIRETGVFAGSERLELAEEPIDEAISGNELELDGLYDGLESGRWLIITGERADVVAKVWRPSEKVTVEEKTLLEKKSTEVQVAGVPATELVMLAAVEQRFDSSLAGDKTHTYLRLSNSLAYSYKRDTVIVYGNVVNSTHGETRKEVLGSGNAAKELQEFTLKQTPLTFVAAPNPDGVETTLQVRVNDVLWHEADSLAGLGPNDYRYITRTDDQNKTSVIFGTGDNGARLPTGPDNVTAVYRNGMGKVGNVRPDQISLLATKPLGVKAVT
ncbi:MAG TPA: hypothetical protein VEV42_08755, partial [Pyrinomonadaceae bacterium]|nr:hypothetical protein [Pyrinomonadaceae bacterium]